MKHSLNTPFIPHINNQDFTRVTKLLRKFFTDKGYIEVYTQNRLSILAACEDPNTISTFNYNNFLWPLPQTGQMWLEHELLNSDDNYEGYFCLSTSYRNEPNPILGRHCLIFPMFEFESYGDLNTLEKLLVELLDYLGFVPPVIKEYEDISNEYNESIITSKVESMLNKDYGSNVFIKNFPERSNPFWNMKRTNDTANKIDVILHGHETIGSAERETDTEIMRNRFFSIEDGKYADKIITTFGYSRVIEELNEFLSNRFIKRFGGGIGITRLINAMYNSNI
jgi:aspartyl/asparaginyl-tRNA synthetase